jgi:hypothetical protein
MEFGRGSTGFHSLENSFRNRLCTGTCHKTDYLIMMMMMMVMMMTTTMMICCFASNSKSYE